MNKNNLTDILSKKDPVLLTSSLSEQRCLLYLKGMADLATSLQIKRYLLPLIEQGISNIEIDLCDNLEQKDWKEAEIKFSIPYET